MSNQLRICFNSFKEMEYGNMTPGEGKLTRAGTGQWGVFVQQYSVDVDYGLVFRNNRKGMYESRKAQCHGLHLYLLIHFFE